MSANASPPRFEPPTASQAAGSYYPPPPETRSYQQPQQNYPPPPQEFSPPPVNNYQSQHSTPPPINTSQYFPPPPAQSPPPQQSSSPPPPLYAPPTSQQPPQFARQARQSSFSKFSPPPQSAPPTQTHFQFGNEKSRPLSPPPAGGAVGSQHMYADASLAPGQALDDNNPANMPGGAPGAAHFLGSSMTTDEVGTFNGGSFRISHRDTNSILTLQLAMGCPVTAKPGAMLGMTPTVTLKGAMKFSLKKIVIGGEIAHSTFTGPGEVLIAPPTIGDITAIRFTGKESWNVGRDAFLAATQGIVKDYKSQGIGKAMFSGEGLFVYRITGVGLLWVSSFGAIIRKDLQEGERYIVDNGHLVAWNCKYVMERAASGGIMSGVISGEGLVCKFTGPGAIFIQTRQPAAFGVYMAQHATMG
ncbi:hypothetical protein MMC25_001360 [Agyrium rufum]|nr:hypothetical protein [Agyrium rufum]